MARRGRVLRSECTRLRADLRASSAAQHLQRKLQVLFVQVPARSNAMQEVKRLEGAGERAGLCRRAWTKKKAHGPAEPMRAARPGFNPRADLFAFCFYSPKPRPSVVRFPPTATTNRLQGSLGVGFQRLAGWGVIRSRCGCGTGGGASNSTHCVLHCGSHDATQHCQLLGGSSPEWQTAW